MLQRNVQPATIRNGRGKGRTPPGTAAVALRLVATAHRRPGRLHAESSAPLTDGLCGAATEWWGVILYGQGGGAGPQSDCGGPRGGRRGRLSSVRGRTTLGFTLILCRCALPRFNFHSAS